MGWLSGLFGSRPPQTQASEPTGRAAKGRAAPTPVPERLTTLNFDRFLRDH